MGDVGSEDPGSGENTWLCWSNARRVDRGADVEMALSSRDGVRGVGDGKLWARCGAP